MVEDDAEQPATEKATTIAAAIRKLIFDRPLHADNTRQQRRAEHMFYNETDARFRILFPDPERATAGSVPPNLKKSITTAPPHVNYSCGQ